MATHYRDRNRGGGQRGGGGAPTAPTLTISNVIYKSTEQTLHAVVTATRGDKVATGINVQWFLDGNTVGEQGTTDGNGRAKLFIKDLVLTPREYSLQVRAIGFNVMGQETFSVAKPGEAGADSVSLELIGDAIQVPDGFELSLHFKATKGNQSIANKAVDFEYLGQTTTRYTDVSGRASTVINIPHPTKALKRFVEVRCVMEDPPAETQKVFELQWQVPEVKEANFLDPVKTGPNEYTVRVIVEGPTGAGVSGLKISAGGGEQVFEGITNEYGILDIILKCKPDQEKTKFKIDIPGIHDSRIFELKGDKATEEGVKKEKRLGEEAPLLGHFKQGFRIGSRRSKLSDEEKKNV